MKYKYLGDITQENPFFFISGWSKYCILIKVQYHSFRFALTRAKHFDQIKVSQVSRVTAAEF